MGASNLLERIFAAHVAFLWQAGVLAALLFAILRVVPKRSAALRYRIAVVCLIAAALLPGIAMVQAVGEEALRLANGFTDGAVSAAPALTLPAQEALASLPERTTLLTASSSELFEAGADASFARLLLALWFLGVSWLSIRQWVAWRRVLQLQRIDAEAVPAPWNERIERLAERIGLRRQVRLLQSARIDSPMALGWLKPVVFLPTSALTGLSRSELEALLMHELAHVRRWDYAVNLVQVVIETLFFYHPCVWWMSRIIRIERENACDDLAVEMCGDRVTYVTALTAMEEQRGSLSFAMQATGTGLVARVRRLLGPEARSSAGEWRASRGHVSFGVGTMIAFPLTFVSLAGLSVFASPLELTEPAPTQEGVRQPVTRSSGELRGLWLGEWSKGRFKIQMRRSGAQQDWNNTMTFTTRELSGLVLGADARFQLEREAGTIEFTGDLLGDESAGDGTGRFVFTSSSSYVAAMDELGYRGLSTAKLFDFCLFDVTTQFVKDLRELGYRPSLKDLTSMAIHRVTPEYIQSFRKLGYEDLPIRTLISMQIHDVTADFAREMSQFSKEQIPAKTLVSLQIHDVTPAFARELRSLGYEGFRIKDLQNLCIHDVTPQYIRSVEAQLRQAVSLKRLVDMKIHDVSETFMRDMISRFEQIDASKLINMKIHDVEATWVDEMRELGFEFGVDDAVKMNIHDVTPAYVRKLRKDGVIVDTVQDIVRRRIHRSSGVR